jgi:type IV pilus assembly protein PilE
MMLTMQKINFSRDACRGFTLIEMMIVVAIVGILAAIAYPSYISQIEKGKRAECRSGLLKAMQQQERYFTQRNTYVTATSVITSYSGDNPSQSACTIAADKCTTSTPLTECVELIATPTYTESKIDTWYVDSSGQKQCKLAGGSKGTDRICWP